MIFPKLFIMLLYEHIHLVVKGPHLVDLHLMGGLCGSSGGDHMKVRLEKRFTRVPWWTPMFRSQVLL